MEDGLLCSDCRLWERKAASDLSWLLFRGKKWISSSRHPPFTGAAVATALCLFTATADFWWWFGQVKGYQEDWAMRGIWGMFLEETDLWVSRLAREALKTEDRLGHCPPELGHPSSAARGQQNSGFPRIQTLSRNCASHSPTLSFSHLELAILPAFLCHQLGDSFFVGFSSSIIAWANSPDKSIPFHILILLLRTLWRILTSMLD